MTRRRGLAVWAGVVAGVAALAWATSSFRATADLTAGRSLTLTGETRDIVSRVHRPVTITALLRRDDPGRAEAAALLSRYSRRNRNISVRIADPNDMPGEMRRLGVDPATDTLAVTTSGVGSGGGKVEKGTTVTEQDVTS